MAKTFLNFRVKNFKSGRYSANRWSFNFCKDSEGGSSSVGENAIEKWGVWIQIARIDDKQIDTCLRTRAHKLKFPHFISRCQPMCQMATKSYHSNKA